MNIVHKEIQLPEENPIPFWMSEPVPGVIPNELASEILNLESKESVLAGVVFEDGGSGWILDRNTDHSLVLQTYNQLSGKPHTSLKIRLSAFFIPPENRIGDERIQIILSPHPEVPLSRREMESFITQYQTIIETLRIAAGDDSKNIVIGGYYWLPAEDQNSDELQSVEITETTLDSAKVEYIPKTLRKEKHGSKTSSAMSGLRR